LELKAIEKLEGVHKAKAINYLEAYNMADGLLINFGNSSLDFKWVYNKKLIAKDQLKYKTEWKIVWILKSKKSCPDNWWELKLMLICMDSKIIGEGEIVELLWLID